jgi:molybdopterin synthase sulfur carrier subunit
VTAPDLTGAGPLTVRYFAGARAAAGRQDELITGPLTLDALVRQLSRRHGARLEQVLAGCSYLVDGVAWHRRDTPIPAGSTVDVLPPFAGG